MLGDLQGMMGKLQEAQKEIEATKKRLDTVMVDGKANQDRVKVTVTANRKVKAIEIDNSLLQDKEELEDSLILALNHALEKATDIHEAELAAATKKNMPNIPGLF